jgi:hypothetical protein
MATATDFTPFERTVLDGLLEGDHVVLAALRSQLASATVSDRNFTKPGCFVDIQVAPNVNRVDPASFHIGDVHLELDSCEHGAAAILFVRDGSMSFLELVAYMEDWPQSPSLRRLSYLSPQGTQPIRDLKAFASSLEPNSNVSPQT